MSAVTSVWNPGAITIAGLVSMAALTTPASAAPANLFVKVGQITAPGETKCLGFAGDAARDMHLQRIKEANRMVTGVLNDKSVVVVCVGTVAVISVAGQSSPELEALAEGLFQRMSQVKTF